MSRLNSTYAHTHIHVDKHTQSLSYTLTYTKSAYINKIIIIRRRI